jgi:hypothetical protein
MTTIPATLNAARALKGRIVSKLFDVGGKKMSFEGKVTSAWLWEGGGDGQEEFLFDIK